VLFIFVPRLICISQVLLNSGWKGEKKWVLPAPSLRTLSHFVWLKIQAGELPEEKTGVFQIIPHDSIL
jgi:hypothetical protein